jgi:hypothetical protein
MGSAEFEWRAKIAARLSNTLDFDDKAVNAASEKYPEHYTLELSRFDEDLLYATEDALNVFLHLRADAEILGNMHPDQIFDLLLGPDEIVEEWERKDKLKQQNPELLRETSQFMDSVNEVPPDPARIRKVDGKPILFIDAAAVEKPQRIEGLEEGKEGLQKHIKFVENILREEQKRKEGTFPIKEHQIYKRGDRASL